MEATSDPSVPAGPARSAPGRLELVRRFVNRADLAAGADELEGLDGLAAWLRERALIGPGDHLAPDDRQRALAVREALRNLLENRSGGSPGEGAGRAPGPAGL